ncbi:ATP-dependent zinc metalloprotease FtsH [Myxococcota bacterium]|nr:ATP-dependent zinc metalloprotease FtsH [Myxococcota bacterium]MBU1413704.1 ATP-dependent zinc metalloprotease FtsH [Myxococcota bacterium]MBU1511622.1 ATP-dependent zinc metalloprotease FtsH [Myxococcota bacterium]
MKQSHKTILVWVILITLFVMLFKMYNTSEETVQEIKFSTFVRDVENGVRFEDVKIVGNRVKGKYQDGARKFKTYGLVSPELLEKMDQEQVEYAIDKEEESMWPSLLISWLPMLLLFVLFFVFLRQLQGGAGKAMSFGKARARLNGEGDKKVTFDDVAGVEEAKEEVSEIVDFLKDPRKFTRLGGEIPRGVLLVGSPGTGKTLLARAIAGEAGVPFYSISGSDFVEMFVGVGASRVRDLFEQGRKSAPCIIFIDEIDAVGRHRGAGLGGGHDEREQTLNQLLVEMDGFDGKEGIILIAATNRPDVLDPALLRPGRFDRRVVVNLPDVRGREAILQVHVTNRGVPLNDDVKLQILAKGTPGFSGADLANLVNEAALIAARTSQDNVTHDNFEMAKDKILMGAERRSMVINDKEKKITAYHEAGHAVVAMLVPGEKDPIHKATIIPRGQALGLVMRLPEEDRHNMSREFLFNLMAVSLGGRISEELTFNMQTSGASSDLETCTKIARKMVCEWGMSDKLGPLTYGAREEEIFLGREVTVHRDISEETAKTIDSEVYVLVSRAFDLAKEILTTHIDVLERVAQMLIEKETLNREDLEKLIPAPTIPAPSPTDPGFSLSFS